MRTSLDIIAIFWILGFVLLLILAAPLIGLLFKMFIYAALFYFAYRLIASIVRKIAGSMTSSRTEADDIRSTYTTMTEYWNGDDSVDEQ